MQGRIHKVIAAAGVASRRGAEELVRAGRVSVDGRPAEVGQSVDTETQRILVDGKPIASPDAPRAYWVLNKPAGVVSTVRDRHAARTVLDLLPPDVRHESRLYPVGRLDEESEGLLLLTNDGAWADQILHPRYAVEREYMAGLSEPVTRRQRAALLGGVELEEGIGRFDLLEEASDAQARRVLDLLEPPYPQLRWYRVVLAQGWKRQIRRMFSEVGQPVRRLVRVRVGSLRLTGLGPGESRPLHRREVAQLAASARRQTAAGPSAGVSSRP